MGDIDRVCKGFGGMDRVCEGLREGVTGVVQQVGKSERDGGREIERDGGREGERNQAEQWDSVRLWMDGSAIIRAVGIAVRNESCKRSRCACRLLLTPSGGS